MHRSFKYKNELYMASYDVHIFIMFLKIEQVENLVITTMSLIYRNVPNGKHQYSRCIQMHNRLIVLYKERNIMN